MTKQSLDGGLISLLQIAAAMALWYGLSQILPSFVLPAPTRVIGAWRNDFIDDVAVTALRSTLGFVFGIFVAYSIGFLGIALNRSQVILTSFSSLRVVPFIAAMPLFVIWFGFSEGARLAVVGVSAFAFFVPGLVGALVGLPREKTLWREYMKQAYPHSYVWVYYANVCVPGTFAEILPSLRVCWAVSLTIAIAVDYMGSSVGIGRLVDSARVTFNVPAIFLLILMSAAFGVAIDRMLVSITSRIAHWEARTAKA